MLTQCQNSVEAIEMPKGSIELTNAKKEEIIRACASLYETMSFKDITMQEIGAVTSRRFMRLWTG